MNNKTLKSKKIIDFLGDEREHARSRMQLTGNAKHFQVNQRFFVSRKFIKFSRRSMEVNPLSLVIAAAILGAVLFIFFYGILPILTGKQVPWIKGQTEYVAQDCDEDGVIGINDKCPCDSSKQNIEKGQKCGPATEQVIKNCPNLCKK